MIVSAGIKKLREKNDSEYFKNAYRFNVLLIFLSFLGSILKIIDYASKSEIVGLLSTLDSIIVFALEFMMILEIIEGTIDYFKQKNREELCLEFAAKKKAFSILKIITALGLLLAYAMNSKGLLIWFSLIGIVVRIYVMLIMNRARKIETELSAN